MITALNIEQHIRKGPGRLLSLFGHNRIRVEHLYCDAAAVKNIVYEHRRGQVNWSAVDRFVRSQREVLLCPEEVELPAEYGYRRYRSATFSRRMCENAAIYLLDAIGAGGAKTVLVDDSGDSVSLCRYLCDYCNPVYVVCKDTALYTAEAERLLEEKGAALVYSRGDRALRDADLVIAPGRISRDLGCAGMAVILSGERPLTPQNAPVIYDYFFDLPDKYRQIKPAYLSDMYFASALYDLAGAHELGSYIFKRCGDGRVIHTRNSLLQQLKMRLQSLT